MEHKFKIGERVYAKGVGPVHNVPQTIGRSVVGKGIVVGVIKRRDGVFDYQVDIDDELINCEEKDIQPIETVKAYAYRHMNTGEVKWTTNGAPADSDYIRDEHFDFEKEISR
jgi:hypothetical protein